MSGTRKPRKQPPGDHERQIPLGLLEKSVAVNPSLLAAVVTVLYLFCSFVVDVVVSVRLLAAEESAQPVMRRI